MFILIYFEESEYDSVCSCSFLSCCSVNVVRNFCPVLIRYAQIVCYFPIGICVGTIGCCFFNKPPCFRVDEVDVLQIFTCFAILDFDSAVCINPCRIQSCCSVCRCIFFCQVYSLNLMKAFCLSF